MMITILLLVVICSFPIEALFLKRLDWIGVVFVMNVLAVHILFFLAIREESSKEGYAVKQKDKRDYFPWNEVNIVKKRSPESTVVECGWELVQIGKEKEPTPNFQENDPVVHRFNNMA